MFNKQNFCHIASNNRNDVKIGVFVYKTTDDLDTVSANGYFNDQIIDINLHDLIIHEWHDPTDRTNVQYNLLCVVERTLENVGTVVIKSSIEETLEEAVEQIDGFVKKTGDTMSGPLAIKQEVSSSTYSYPLLSLCASYNGSDKPIELGVAANGSNLYLSGSLVVNSEIIPKSSATSPKRLGGPLNGQHWDCVYTKKIYNGYSLNVPQKAGTLATIEDINEALVNAGSSLTTKGVWYAQMYAGTIPPAAEDGTNYADFSQTDGQGNPIIVIYERQNGAWVQTETITPPANYNGYVMITSKIWDIPEQSGQQGGQVNWDCVHKTFTPYPKIISFENAALTGNSTVQMPITPTNNSIVNKDYVDTAIDAAIASIPSTAFDLFDIKWRDSTTSNTAWALSDGNWKNGATAYTHLASDITPAYAWNGGADNIYYTTSDTPQVGDSVYQAVNGVITTTPVDTIAGVAGNNSYISVGFAQYFREDTLDGYFNQETETIAGITITFFRATDGHKICLADQKTNVDDLYAATGVAWYYVLDTENEQFILPRTQFGFNGVRTNAGDYVAPGLPNITGQIGRDNNSTGFAKNANLTGCFKLGSSQANCATSSSTNGYRIGFDASLSNSIYGASSTVQAPATQMYLYFYIGA